MVVRQPVRSPLPDWPPHSHDADCSRDLACTPTRAFLAQSELFRLAVIVGDYLRFLGRAC
jgi:hypothetical protein